jgi:hypothetical protein
MLAIGRGPDQIYDPDLVPALVETIRCLIRPTGMAVIAATVRNEKTFGVFLDQCGMSIQHSC